MYHSCILYCPVSLYHSIAVSLLYPVQSCITVSQYHCITPVSCTVLYHCILVSLFHSCILYSPVSLYYSIAVSLLYPVQSPPLGGSGRKPPVGLGPAERQELPAAAWPKDGTCTSGNPGEQVELKGLDWLHWQRLAAGWDWLEEDTGLVTGSVA